MSRFTASVQNYFDRWLNKRIPEKRAFQLDMSNIFIFPSRFGIVFLILCLALFVLGSNYQNNLMLLLSFFLVSLFLVTLLTSYANFAKLHLQLGKVTSVFAGEELFLPIWLSDKNQSSDATHLPLGSMIFRLWNSRIKTSIDMDALTNPIQIQVPTKNRGLMQLPRITIENHFPIGLYRCWTHLRFQAEVIIYPKPITCDIRKHAISSDNEETELESNIGGNENFDSLKQYVVGEPLHRVAWKQVAKGQGMYSKEFSANQTQDFEIRLNDYLHNGLEFALSNLCYIVIELSNQNASFGLQLGNTTIPPDSGSVHREHCLKTLALYKNGNVS